MPEEENTGKEKDSKGTRNVGKHSKEKKDKILILKISFDE